MRTPSTRATGAGLAAAAVLAVTMLAGCTGATGSSGAAGLVGEASAQAAPSEAAGAASSGVGYAGLGSGPADSDNAAPTRGASDSAADPNTDTPLVDGRSIIRTATVSLQVTVRQPHSPSGHDAIPSDEATRRALADAAAQAATKVRALAPGSGGYVSASDGGGATVSVVLRIPASSYAGVMNSLDGIGEITSRTEKTSDVTDEMVDVASRVATMKASIERIRALLAKADKIGDVISIESELASREADLESLQNRQTALKDQVALSTISVTVTAVLEGTVAQVASDHQDGFLAGLAGGWRALKAFVTWLGSVIGALLPFAPLIVVVALVAVWVSRRRGRAAGPGRPAAGPGSPATASPTTGSPTTGAGDLT